MRAATQTPGKRLGHYNAAAHYYHIDIFGRTLQEYVAHVAADYVALQSQFIRCFGNPLKYAVTETLLQFFCRQFNHLSINHFEGAKIRILFFIFAPTNIKNENYEESSIPCVPLLHALLLQQCREKSRRETPGSPRSV